jgi:hypothetical protein
MPASQLPGLDERAICIGAAGGIYRLLVIGTRGHVVAVRHLLALIARRAESRARR